MLELESSFFFLAFFEYIDHIFENRLQKKCAINIDIDFKLFARNFNTFYSIECVAIVIIIYFLFSFVWFLHLQYSIVAINCCLICWNWKKQNALKIKNKNKKQNTHQQKVKTVKTKQYIKRKSFIGFLFKCLKTIRACTNCLHFFVHAYSIHTAYNTQYIKIYFICPFISNICIHFSSLQNNYLFVARHFYIL